MMCLGLSQRGQVALGPGCGHEELSPPSVALWTACWPQEPGVMFTLSRYLCP